MTEKEKQAWDVILQVADQLPADTAAYLQGYAQGLADGSEHAAG